jgi:hypothetical protein
MARRGCRKFSSPSVAKRSGRHIPFTELIEFTNRFHSVGYKPKPDLPSISRATLGAMSNVTKTKCGQSGKSWRRVRKPIPAAELASFRRMTPCAARAHPQDWPRRCPSRTPQPRNWLRSVTMPAAPLTPPAGIGFVPSHGVQLSASQPLPQCAAHKLASFRRHAFSLDTTCHASCNISYSAREEACE